MRTRKRAVSAGHAQHNACVPQSNPHPCQFLKAVVQCSSRRWGRLTGMRALADVGLLHCHCMWSFASKEVGCGKGLLLSALPGNFFTACPRFPFIGRLFCILSGRIFTSVASALCCSSPICSSETALLQLQHLNHLYLMTLATFYVLYATTVTSLPLP